MLQARFSSYNLHFKVPSGTSRGVLTDKETYFIQVWDTECPEKTGIGECALFRGLSADDKPEYEKKLGEVCNCINNVDFEGLKEWSSIRFGVEMAFRDLHHGGRRLYFPSDFTEGRQSIEINGLIWMGDQSTMRRRIEEKLLAGFRCIKLKIGAIHFEEELALLAAIRERFSASEVELRVDANGAFTPHNALECLEALAQYDLHSIEQPIRAGQWNDMAQLCDISPVPIALDEELIGINDVRCKMELLDAIRPAFLILKPSLCGGFSGAAEWIRIARQKHIGWWVTSALESNIGLNALSQWTATLDNTMPQGLGTGQLYINNFPTPLDQKGNVLSYLPQKESTQIPELLWKK